jgi:hypothetical protein
VPLSADNVGMALSVPPQRRPVEIARHVPVPVDVAVAVLRQDPRDVIGPRLRAPVPDRETYADLGVEVLGGRRVARDVRVGFGPLIEDDDAMAVPVWWEAAEHPELFPTFDGGLEVRAAADGTELRLVGSYQPPLGSLGRFADSLVGYRIVLASLERLLSAAATRLVTLAATR